ncbi:TadE/TadG family type IV pilus assembly protein [Microbacterium tenebrionis]|uniref:Pilus assembly protein n=1 Tax=Microbacterium tenebrionis TaxID=2830665 RepID=A0A9X1LR92_9MICO|nr:MULTISPECIES: TadE/TadG family type IV pilus assembly protein [Microbacterium]MCC2030460.1 pilus assembly protein [Microbacterium tenebrionis]
MLRWADAGEDRGSSPVDFVLVGALLTALTLAVLQLGFAVYVRNVVHDAAVEGAHYAALADTTLDDGAERTRLAISRAVGDAFTGDIVVSQSDRLGHPTAVVTVRTTLPIIGLIGVPYALEVDADAPMESLGDE